MLEEVHDRDTIEEQRQGDGAEHPQVAAPD
jgi:hypothetical protein